MKIILELAPFELTNELISVIRRTGEEKPVSIPEKGEQPKTAAETPKNVVETPKTVIVNQPPKKTWEAQKPAEQPRSVKDVDKGTGTIVGSPTPDGELIPIDPKPVQQPLLPVAEPKTFTIKDLITAATAFTRDHPEMRDNVAALIREGYKVRSINDLPQEQINAFAMDLREMGAQI